MLFSTILTILLYLNGVFCEDGFAPVDPVLRQEPSKPSLIPTIGTTKLNEESTTINHVDQTSEEFSKSSSSPSTIVTENLISKTQSKQPSKHRESSTVKLTSQTLNLTETTDPTTNKYIYTTLTVKTSKTPKNNTAYNTVNDTSKTEIVSTTSNSNSNSSVSTIGPASNSLADKIKMANLSTWNFTTKSVLNSENVTKDLNGSLKVLNLTDDRAYTTPANDLNNSTINLTVTLQSQRVEKKYSSNGDGVTRKANLITTIVAKNETISFFNDTLVDKNVNRTKGIDVYTTEKESNAELTTEEHAKTTEKIETDKNATKNYTLFHHTATTEVSMNSDYSTTTKRTVQIDKQIVCQALDCGKGGKCILKSNKAFCECNWGRKGILCEVNLRPLITCIIVLGSIFLIVLLILVVKIIRQRRFAKWKITKFKSAKRDVYTTMPGSHKLINAPCRTSKRKSDAAYANLYEY